MDYIQVWSKKLGHLQSLEGNPILGYLALDCVFNPCLTLQEVEGFEARYDITLPEDYRRFILEIGDGGDGPWKGILPLRRFFSMNHNRILDDLKKPFLHQSPWSYNQISEAERDQYDMDPFSLTQGALPISDVGCGIAILLVITGPQRGTIWIDDTESDGLLKPEKNGSSFTEWYSQWLDQLWKLAAQVYHFQI
ncbi:MAG: SMI1/KNR4 family protein [Acidobacteria bacterium]|nr:SMI1/KNR4 family protein [Acidobacteriota bacterium]